MKKTNNKMACGICGREFKGERGIIMHMRRAHPEARDNTKETVDTANAAPPDPRGPIVSANHDIPIWARLITDFEGAVRGAEMMKLHAAQEDARKIGSEEQWNKVIDHQLDRKRTRLLLIMEMLFGRAKVADRLERELLNDCE